MFAPTFAKLQEARDAQSLADAKIELAKKILSSLTLDQVHERKTAERRISQLTQARKEAQVLIRQLEAQYQAEQRNRRTSSSRNPRDGWGFTFSTGSDDFPENVRNMFPDDKFPCGAKPQADAKPKPKAKPKAKPKEKRPSDSNGPKPGPRPSSNEEYKPGASSSRFHRADDKHRSDRKNRSDRAARDKPNSHRKRPEPEQPKPKPKPWPRPSQKARGAADDEKWQTAVDAWIPRAHEALKSMATLTQFPEPPSRPCYQSECEATASNRKLEACKCNLIDCFSGKTSEGRRRWPDGLKRERLRWHPDRFSGCPEAQRTSIQECAKEVFVVVNQMFELEKDY